MSVGDPSVAVAARQQQQQQPNDAAEEGETDLTSVQVAVRIRPSGGPSSSPTDDDGDADDDEEHCIRVLPPVSRNALQIGGSRGPMFTFDAVIPPSAKQVDVYDTIVAPLVTNCLEGYNATVLAYGQTGSGKTYTVMGESSPHDHSTSGIIPRAIRDVFRRLKLKKTTTLSSGSDGEKQTETRTNGSNTDEPPNNNNLHSVDEYDDENDENDDNEDDDDESASSSWSFVIKLQFLELYGEDIRDLLGGSTSGASTVPHKLSIREVEGEPEVIGAAQLVVQTPDEALLALTHGMVRRVTGATAMNTASSRSHAILTLLIEQQDTASQLVRTSKFHFVDLAGSERQKRTGAVGRRLKEGIDINKGLLVLGNVISALASQAPFVPYRDSKLTRLLQGSLGGNHKTLMIVCVSPHPSNMDESLNCLRYANRAKNITNKAVVNDSGGHGAWEQKCHALQVQLTRVAKHLLEAVDHHGYTLGPLSAANENNHGGDNAAATSSVNVDPPLTREVLAALVTNGAVGATTTVHRPPTTTTAPRSSINHSPRLDLELELNRTRQALADSQRHHDAAEQELYHLKAQKRVTDALTAMPPRSNDLINSSSTAALQVQLAAVATDYEREIGQLKRALEEAEAKHRARREWSGGGTDDDGVDEQAIQRLHAAVDEDRRRLAQLRDDLGETNDSAAGGAGLDAAATPTLDTPRRMEREEKAEEAQLRTLTKKYLEDDDDEEALLRSSARESVERDTANEQADDAATVDTRHLRADLVELSRNIAAKEDLIGQLRLSREKYASMREFYEERLQQMEQLLTRKESEREQLIQELQRSKHSSGDEEQKLLKERLQEKESELSSLRKNQKELQELTRVSSRNNVEIHRLQEEVVTMKRRKVDLQKQLGQERKHHATEKKQLEKHALQKDREAHKWQKLSSQHGIQAERANQVAKARLEEIGQLRSKYKDAEKKIRVLSLKRGVMEKAGISHVMVGRRSRGAVTKDDSSASGSGAQRLDFDALRDIFDQKVAEVVRKEAIADKLANEWEAHFELTSKKQELLSKKEEGFEEAAQSLSIQIQFKEDRIRQLAQRLGKRVEQSEGEEPISPTSRNDSFLFDGSFEKQCAGCSIEQKKSIASKVLFGMVVRERRRVASLARTASALDERAQAAEKTALENEEALRSYMNDQRRELAALKQSQQEQILSLMDLVKQDSASTVQDSNAMTGDELQVDQRLLVLANERIALLERQLEELKADASTAASYRDRVDELSDDVKLYTQENEEFQNDLSELRSVLRQIRELVVNCGHRQSTPEADHTDAAILEIINCALHPRKAIPKSKPKPSVSISGRASVRRAISPRMKKHVELMHTSDSEEEGDAPDWAAEIMNDLALIAEGKVPPSLEGSSFLPTGDFSFETPGPTASLNTSKRGASHLKRGTPDRLALSREINARLDQIVIPGSQLVDPLFGGKQVEVITPPAAPDMSSHPPNTGYKSVFERLISPSHYTGTQKERFSHQAKRTRSAKDPASKLLDDLLQSDTESTKPRKEKGVVQRQKVEYAQQDVFERLNKTTTQAYAVKQNNPLRSDAQSPGDIESDEVLDELLRSDSEACRQTTGDSKMYRLKGDYTQQDVFERLTKTTTHAFAVKQNELVKPPALQKAEECVPKSDASVLEKDRSVSQDELSKSEQESSRQRLVSKAKADYIQQDVFERLQRTTTHAYAVKHLDAHFTDEKDHISPTYSTRSTKSVDDASPTFSNTRVTTKESSAPAGFTGEVPPRLTGHEKAPASDYVSQDVFERLQKTTTEAYAKKSSRHDDFY